MWTFKESPLIVRNVKGDSFSIYLSFDDGPDSEFTPQILDLLAEERTSATFFVIGQKARAQKPLIERILKEGHCIMSHSLDHSYSHYFKGRDHLKTWLQNSLDDLSQITQQHQKSFRPPAGVVTPPLVQAAQELQIPLILWRHRFYDSNSQLTPQKVQSNIPRLQKGDIVLLHDRQKRTYRTLFLTSLRQYMQNIKKNGFFNSALSEEIVYQEMTHDP